MSPRPPLSVRERLEEVGAALAGGAPGLSRLAGPAGRVLSSLERAYLSARHRAVYGEGFAPCPVEVPGARAGVARVAHFLGNFVTGGSARLVADLVAGLGAEFCQETAVWRAPFPPHYTGLSVRELRGTRRPGEILGWLRDFEPDLVHVHYWDAPWDRAWYEAVLAAAGAWGRPVVENVNVPCAPLVHPAVAGYVYVSEWARNAFGGATKCRVIHPGTDLSLFAPLAGGAAGEAVGMVYRLDRDKLGERSLDPLIRLCQIRPGTRAVVAGAGPLARGFRRRAAGTGISFPGAVPYGRLPELYAGMGVFAAPVVSESFGSSAVYAMAMGIPVAGYVVGALPEVVGGTGALAPPGDAEALALAIAGLLDDPERRRSLGALAAARARERFSLGAMLESYRKLYGELL